MARNWSSVTPVTQLPASQIFNSLTPKKKQSMSPYVSLCGGFLHSLKILRGRLYSAPHQSVILILLISHVPARSALSHHKGQVASPEGRKWCRGCHVACSLEEYQTLEAAICSNHKGSHEAQLHTQYIHYILYLSTTLLIICIYMYLYLYDFI